MMEVTFERYLQFFNEIFKTDHAHMRSHMSCSLTCIIRPLWFQRLVARLLVKMSQIRFDATAASSFLLEASVPSLLGDLWSPPSWRAKAGSGLGADPGERLAQRLGM